MSTDKHWSSDEIKTRELIAEQSALLTLRGVGINEQTKQLAKEYDLTLTRTKLIALRRHPKYHEMIQKDAEAKIESGTLAARLGCIELIPDCIAALKKQIAEGNVKAIETAIKTALGDTKKDTPEQQQAIQIIVASDAPGKLPAKAERPV